MSLADHADSLREWERKFRSLDGIEHCTYWNAFHRMNDVCTVDPYDVTHAYDTAREEMLRHFPSEAIPDLGQVARYLVEVGLWKHHSLDSWDLYEFTHVSALARETPDAPCVYFLRAGISGPVKIGRSTRLRLRISTLQTGNHESLRTLATIPGGKAMETILHQRFAAARRAGEWFEPVPELLALIREIGGVL